MSAFKKILAMNTDGLQDDDVIAEGKTRLVQVDEDGVTFTSHLDGSQHRFTPEISMQIQHQLGADILFAFDECTTLMNTRTYQEQSVARTQRWAARCLAEHVRLTRERAPRPYQALFAVVQGAQYEDLRRRAARDLVSLTIDGSGFDGYGIGGALEKENLGTIVRWVSEELPEDKTRHLLGISEPDDIFTAIENGVDAFDCVAPSRVARNAAVYTARGRFNVTSAACRRSFLPIDEDLRLLHVRALHAGVPPPSIQGSRDARLNAVHHPLTNGSSYASLTISVASIEAGSLLRLQDRLPGSLLRGEMTARPRRASVFPRQGHE